MSNNGKKTAICLKDGIFLLAAFLCGAAIVAADQITKLLVMKHMELGETLPFLPGFLDLSYIHNSGGAWGILSGKTYLLLPVTLLVMAVCVFFLRTVYQKSKLLLWAITFVLAGGIGNMIDRVFRGGNVVDFLHFEFFPSFPVFNVADCAIVAGAGLLILYFLLDLIKAKRGKAESSDEDA